MLLSMYYIKDGISRLKVLITNCKTQMDINVLKTKSSAVLSDMVFACEEIAFTTDSYNYIRIKETLLSTNRLLSQSEDKEQIAQALTTVIEQFDGIDFDALSTYNFKRNCGTRAMRFVPTSEACLNRIAAAIPRLYRDIQFLDSRCNSGDNLRNLTRGFERKITYGIEADQNVASKAKEKINRVAAGQFAGSRITNDAFDVLVTEPIIGWQATFNGCQNPLTFKTERVFLLNTIKYLRPNGIGVMILPYYRLYKDICLFIAKHYSNVQIRKLGSDFYDYGAVVIIGTKREDTKEVDEATYQLLRKCHNQEKIKDILTNPLEAYTLPRDLLPIDIFRGSVLDPNELLSIVQNSGCMEEFWKKQKVEKLSETSKQPLLPFNIGQIGLVLTSGCLDGIIDEGNGNYHLIKGKVSKQSNIERNYNSDTEIETQETISNRVEINVVLPNGDYKVLA